MPCTARGPMRNFSCALLYPGAFRTATVFDFGVQLCAHEIRDATDAWTDDRVGHSI